MAGRLHIKVRKVIQLQNGYIASIHEDNFIRIYDLTFCHICTLIGHYGRITKIISLDDGCLASCSWDSTIKIWDVSHLSRQQQRQTSMGCIKTLTRHTDAVYCIIQLHDGKLMSCSRDNTVKIWDLDSEQVIKTFQGHLDLVYEIMQLSDGRIVSRAFYTSNLYIWNLSYGSDANVIRQSLTNSHSPLTDMIELDNGYLMTIHHGDYFQFWNLSDKSIEQQCIRSVRIDTSIYDLLRLHNRHIACYTIHDLIYVLDALDLFNDSSSDIFQKMTHVGHHIGQYVHEIDNVNINAYNYISCISCITQLQDRSLASCSGDGTIHIWKITKPLYVRLTDSKIALFGFLICTLTVDIAQDILCTEID